MLFRKFYRHASSKTLLRMFLTVVRPLLECAAPVWDPHQLGLISTLERIQKLALRMCAKDWSASYEDLLVRFDLPTLKQRRKLLKLCFLYQVRSGSFFFPNAPVSASPMDPRLRNFNPSCLRGPTPHTLAYASSFFPDALLLLCGTNYLLRLHPLHPSLFLREMFMTIYLT